MRGELNIHLSDGRRISVRHIAAGTLRHEQREHYWLSVGAGTADVQPDELDALIRGLQILRAETRSAEGVKT